MSRRAQSMIMGGYYGLPSREVDPELKPHGLRGVRTRRGIIDQMLLHPRIGTGFANLRTELAATETYWEPAKGSREAAEFAALLGAMCDRDDILTDASELSSSWASVLSSLVDEWCYGFALHNWSWVQREGRLLLEVYPVAASSVFRWRINRERNDWHGICQATELATVEIPREELCYIRTRGIPGQWEGESILRPQVFGFENWKSAAQSMLLILQAASGLTIAKAPIGGTDSTDWRRLEEALIERDAGQRRWLMVPEGYDVQTAYPASSATTGLVEILQYWDAQFDYGMAQSMQSLGFSANGSRALGESMEASGEKTRRANLSILLQHFGANIGRIVARRVGYTGPIPTLKPRQPEPIIEPPEPPRMALSADGDPLAWLDDRVAKLERPSLRARDWRRVAAARLSAEGTLRAAVDEIAADLRRELWTLLPSDRGVPPELPDVRARYIDRFVLAIGEAAEATAAETAAHSRAGRERAGSYGGSYGSPVANVFIARLGEYVTAGAYRAAESMTNRVIAEVEAYWSLGGGAEEFETRQSRLDLEASGVLGAIEGQGELAEAYENAWEVGLVPARAIRTAILDRRVCDHCAEHDGDEHDLLTAAGVEALMAQSLPDIHCAGGALCRCRWTIEYEFLDADAFADYRAEVGPIFNAA